MKGYTMNGFELDIISILRHNNMFHQESMGLIMGCGTGYAGNLLDMLYAYKLKVSGKSEKVRWDYIVIPSYILSIRTLFQALDAVNHNGIVIAEITGKDDKYLDRYKTRLGGLTVTKVLYDNRAYLIIHAGEEYGN